MKYILKILFITVAISSVILMSSCSKKEKTDTDKNTDSIITEDTSAPVDEKNTENEKNTVITDEEKAVNIINSYVNAAKKLDFESMSRYISDNRLPILDSYREAYAVYSVSDERIRELCKARLSTYKITPVSAAKNENNIVVKTNISMVNMESLENKWMETLCNKYPEYTALAADEMTPEVVDVLIQTMIDVLKEAESTIEVQKDFTLTAKGDSWIINAKNEDFFPSN